MPEGQEPEQIARPLGELMAAMAANREIDKAALRRDLDRDVYEETVEATGISSQPIPTHPDQILAARRLLDAEHAAGRINTKDYMGLIGEIETTAAQLGKRPDHDAS